MIDIAPINFVMLVVAHRHDPRDITWSRYLFVYNTDTGITHCARNLMEHRRLETMSPLR